MTCWPCQARLLHDKKARQFFHMCLGSVSRTNSKQLLLSVLVLWDHNVHPALFRPQRFKFDIPRFRNIIDSWPSFSWYLYGNENFKHYSSTTSLFRCSIWSNPLKHHGFWTSSGQGCVQINVNFLTDVSNSKHYQHQISSNSQWLPTSFLPKPFHCSVVQKGDTSNIWEAYIKSVPTLVGA